MTTKCELCGSLIEERYAYSAVILQGAARVKYEFPYGVGKATVGSLGYTLQRRGFFKTWIEAQAEANSLNKNMGLSEIEALEIILGTMRPGGTVHEY